MAPEATDPAFLSEVLTGTLEELNTQIVTPMTYRSLWRGLDWLLGGPLPTGIYDRVLVEPGALHTLCTGAAVRELWGGEPFWSRYRERFDRAVDNPYTGWFEKMFAPRLIVSLLFVPSK